jgi:RNA polymerase sigma factor (sigma-70 family)
MYTLRINENKVEGVRKEFDRLGRICDVVRVTGYSRTLVKCVVNNHFKMIPEDFKDPTPGNTCDMDLYSTDEQLNMENFGEFQYIIDKLPPDIRLVVTEIFVHGTSQEKIGRMIGKTHQAVGRILKKTIRSLRQNVTIS